MKTTTKARILSYLEGKPWTSGSEIEYMATVWETKSSTASRRLRELYEDGQLDRKLIKGCVWYKKRPTNFYSGAGEIINVPTPMPKNAQLFDTPKIFKMEG